MIHYSTFPILFILYSVFAIIIMLWQFVCAVSRLFFEQHSICAIECSQQPLLYPALLGRLVFAHPSPRKAMPADAPSGTAAAFKSAGVPLSDSALVEAERIAAGSNLLPADLVCKWEVWSSSRNRPKGSPTGAELTAFGESLKRSSSSAKNRSSATPLVHRAGPPPPVLKIDDFFSAFASFEGATPADALLEKNPTVFNAGDIADGDRDVHLPDVARGGQNAPSPDTRRTSVIVGGAALGIPADVVLPGDADEEVRAAFARRNDVGKVLTKFNDAPETSRGSRGGFRVKSLPQYVNGDMDNPFTYMNDTLEGGASWVRARILTVGQRILARRTAELVRDGVEDMARPAAPTAFFDPSPNVVLAVGRVRVELDGGGGVGRINLSSVILESEDGNMLKLNLSRMKAMKRPLFLSPGMIAVVEGINKDGGVFDVHAIYDNSIPLADPSVPQNPPVSPPVARCLIAAGPFTLPGNLKYEPLDTLLAHVVTAKPDVVVFLGPFVDETHQHVNECLPIEFSSLFESRVLKRICAASEQTPETNFVLVPAVSDVHHDFVCPQPAFSVNGRTKVGSSVQFVANPAAIVVTDSSGSKSAVLGLSSLPTIADLSGDCVCSDTGDRLASLASHMARQWSFYPPFPASVGLPLDMSNAEQLEFPSCGIDVLITPSKLTQFVKVAESDMVVVNPGMLVRASAGGGAYAELSIPLTRTGSGNVKAAGPRSANLNADGVHGEIYKL